MQELRSAAFRHLDQALARAETALNMRDLSLHAGPSLSPTAGLLTFAALTHGSIRHMERI